MSIKTTNRNLDKLDPDFRKKVDLFLADIKKNHGDMIFITEWYRSQARQDYLYSLWRTTSWNVVTWVKKSIHTLGKAIDIAFRDDKRTKEIEKDLYPSDFEKWREIADVAKKYWIDWLYNLKKIDMPHFQDNWQPLEEVEVENPKYITILQQKYINKWTETILKTFEGNNTLSEKEIKALCEIVSQRILEKVEKDMNEKLKAATKYILKKLEK